MASPTTTTIYPMQAEDTDPDSLTSAELAGIEKAYSLSSTTISVIDAVASLFAHVSKVHSHLDRLHTSNRTPYRTIADLNLHLDQTKQVLTARRKQLTEYQYKLEETEKQRNKLTHEVKQLKRDKQGLVCQLQSIARQKDELDRELKEAQEASKRNRDDAELADRRVNGYRKTADVASSELAKLQTEIRRLKAMTRARSVSPIPAASPGAGDWLGVPEAAASMEAAEGCLGAGITGNYEDQDGYDCSGKRQHCEQLPEGQHQYGGLTGRLRYNGRRGRGRNGGDRWGRW